MAFRAVRGVVVESSECSFAEAGRLLRRFLAARTELLTDAPDTLAQLSVVRDHLERLAVSKLGREQDRRRVSTPSAATRLVQPSASKAKDSAGQATKQGEQADASGGLGVEPSEEDQEKKLKEEKRKRKEERRLQKEAQRVKELGNPAKESVPATERVSVAQEQHVDAEKRRKEEKRRRKEEKRQREAAPMAQERPGVVDLGSNGREAEGVGVDAQKQRVAAEETEKTRAKEERRKAKEERRKAREGAAEPEGVSKAPNKRPREEAEPPTQEQKRAKIDLSAVPSKRSREESRDEGGNSKKQREGDHSTVPSGQLNGVSTALDNDAKKKEEKRKRKEEKRKAREALDATGKDSGEAGTSKPGTESQPKLDGNFEAAGKKVGDEMNDAKAGDKRAREAGALEKRVEKRLKESEKLKRSDIETNGLQDGGSKKKQRQEGAVPAQVDTVERESRKRKEKAEGETAREGDQAAKATKLADVVKANSKSEEDEHAIKRARKEEKRREKAMRDHGQVEDKQPQSMLGTTNEGKGQGANKRKATENGACGDTVATDKSSKSLKKKQKGDTGRT